MSMLQENSGLSYSTIVPEGGFRPFLGHEEEAATGGGSPNAAPRDVWCALPDASRAVARRASRLTVEGKLTMGSVGERLRREREMRGVSLDDIAEATKIGTRLLRALEEEHFDLLPGGIFNKGFVRAYAKYLGLSEDELVADYLQAAGESAPDPRLIAEQNASRIDRSEGDAGNSRMAGFPIIPVLILLVVIAAGAGGWHLYQERMIERRAKQDVERAAAAPPPATSTPSTGTAGLPAANKARPETQLSGQAAASSPSSTSIAATGQETKSSVDLNSPSKPGATPADLTPAKPNPQGATGSPSSYSTAVSGQYFEITVRAKDSAWVSIKSDGKYVVRGIIRPPDVKTIRANEQIVFWTGNAGAIDLTYNGQPYPLVGGPNEVEVVAFTPKGATEGKPPVSKQASPPPSL